MLVNCVVVILCLNQHICWFTNKDMLYFQAKLAQVQDLCELSHSNLLSLYGTASRYRDDPLYIVTG